MSQTLSKNEQLKKNKPEKIKVQRFKMCKYCKEKVVPYGSLAPFCFKMECIREHNKQVKEKAHRKDLKAFRSNDKSALKKDVQKIANRIGKLQDLIKGEGNCVTCGLKSPQMDGGHCYPTSTYSPIRYYTLQIRNQCTPCNRFRHGMPVEFRKYMIKEVGLEKVLWLESFKGQVTKKHTLKYLKKYKRVMSKRLKSLEKRVTLSHDKET